MSVEVVETGRGPRYESEEPEVPGGGQTVPGVPTLQPEVSVRENSLLHCTTPVTRLSMPTCIKDEDGRPSVQ